MTKLLAEVGEGFVTLRVGWVGDELVGVGSAPSVGSHSWSDPLSKPLSPDKAAGSGQSPGKEHAPTRETLQRPPTAEGSSGTPASDARCSWVQKTTLVEIPNEEDDTTFKMAQNREQVKWEKEGTKGLLPSSSQEQVKKEEEPIKARHSESKPVSVSSPKSTWFKPFGMDWTLQAIREACTDLEALASLYLWAHKEKVNKIDN
ncbi:hypothetical protein IW262DRAFT_1468009 [Armillaria fumosa]|nr:hypothetical protein IW262DRAFT_1468009 [Armillaria fumosa]